MDNTSQNTVSQPLTFEEFRSQVLRDYQIACESRQASLVGRKEVLTGKAKFGIFGDGKEVAQLAMARAFRNGDFRSGYYRDQTFMFAAGILTIQEFFAQLYANPDVEAEPSSAGRGMNGHFGTRLLNADGSWKSQIDKKNSSADISPTGGQMPRLLGLAFASSLYRKNPGLANKMSSFTKDGSEIAFGTIGDASTSEGVFFETINAAGVLQVPMAISVWDDGYGISVPARYQTTKQSISEILAGFAQTDEKPGYRIFKGRGWDYPGLVDMYESGTKICREEHIPILFHVTEVTQPQGHSTSGSHERYKTKERLEWEEEFDCIRKMREWLTESAIATIEDLDEIESAAKKTVSDARKKAWDAHVSSIRTEAKEAAGVINNLAVASPQKVFIERFASHLLDLSEPERREIVIAAKKSLRMTKGESSQARKQLSVWLDRYNAMNHDRYSSSHQSESQWNALNVHPVPAIYTSDSPMMDGREILQANFDYILSKYPETVAFGEDVGNIGGVNQTWAGLQQKYGDYRVMDTGIREATIIGQGIGLALRGFRPIAEIQYLDYLAYAIQILSDDLACLQYRTKGGQKAPLIVSTRGHRLEGIWHSGSPMQFILGALRGMHVLVPRNMTQAAGFYNTLLASDEPALVIEPLNGYRIKEKMPQNIGEFKVPLGVPEILEEGEDVTIVTYGSLCRIAQEATKQLSEHGISCELIDVQSLLPFDLKGIIAKSLQKTGKILFLDEDVPGGATAFMMQQVIEKQQGFRYLDATPKTLSAKEHRPAYGSDGDYFSKPSTEDIFDTVYAMMNEYDPKAYPAIY
jgi:pyruvate/2-oxoglutarate/acetoin dehydrogenase E1 component/TPP-dependent pyruvate/acetoin dehydrogenase alpha subunit